MAEAADERELAEDAAWGGGRAVGAQLEVAAAPDARGGARVALDDGGRSRSGTATSCKGGNASIAVDSAGNPHITYGTAIDPGTERPLVGPLTYARPGP